MIVVIALMGIVRAPSADPHHGTTHAAGGRVLVTSGHWLLMVLAMMVPFIAMPARWMAFRSFRRRRLRTVSEFVLGYVALWMLVGVAAALVLAPLHGQVWAVTLLLVVAAVWQVSSIRRAALQRCGPLRAPHIRGWRATVDSLGAGLVVGRRCFVTCWATMLPMVITHNVLFMGSVFLVLANERRPAPNPEARGGRPLEALALLALAGTYALVALTLA